MVNGVSIFFLEYSIRTRSSVVDIFNTCASLTGTIEEDAMARSFVALGN